MSSISHNKEVSKPIIKAKGFNIIRVIPLSILGLVLISYIISLLVVANSKAETKLKNQRDFVVVPGAGITIEGIPSIALRFRLDKAISLYRSKSVKSIFISGKSEEVLTMYNYLLRKKIPKKLIIRDINGDNTYKTIINAYQYMKYKKLKKGAVIVSQRFHIPRITLIAARIKFTNSEYLATPLRNVDNVSRATYFLRESLALFKAFFFNC